MIKSGYLQSVRRKEVERSYFHQKPIGDMSRDELLDVISYYMQKDRTDRAEMNSMMRALCDNRRKRGGSFMQWLFGSRSA